MKNIIRIAILVCALAGCLSCNGFADLLGDVRVTLSLVTDNGVVLTKGTEAGEDTYNEDKIGSIHWYFFDNSNNWLMDGTQTVSGTGSDVALTGFTKAQFESLFSSRDSVKVLVVANSSKTPAGSSGKKLADIKAYALDSLKTFGKQTSFAMCGEGVLTDHSSGSQNIAYTGNIGMKRVASKFRLHLVVKNSYTDTESNEWIPECSSFMVKANRLERYGQVDFAEPDSTKSLSSIEMKAVDNKLKKEEEDTDTQTWTNAEPFYSYPREWKIDDSDYPYLYITLPWTKDDGSGGSETQNTYYRVLFPDNSFDSNYLYDITIKLDGLGSLVPEIPVEVGPLTLIITGNWRDAIDDPDLNDTDADMTPPHVLSVDREVYYVYNEDSITIPFISTHPCEVVKLTGGYQDSGAGTTVKTSDIVVDNDAKTVKITHKLTNMPDDGSTTYDYQEFIQTFRIKHTTEGDVYYQDFKIVQKPALCVSTETFTADAGKSTIFVDSYGYVTASDTYHVLSTSKTEGTLTRISATVLPTVGLLADFSLGEVRSKSNCFGTAPFITGYDVYVRTGSTTEKFVNTSVSGRRLAYYYKAREDASEMVSPEIIVASSLPGVGGHYMNYEQAQLRCATFQEEGYPAGRWRLPTYAEMCFIFKLQLDDKVGMIFDTDNTTNISSDGRHYSPYACADGNFYRANNSKNAIEQVPYSNRPTGSVRCVYDSWYWDQLPEYEETTGTSQERYENSRRLPSSQWTTFTWGDKEINWGD